jgi:hypothetical protein
MSSALDALQERTYSSVTSTTASSYPPDMRLSGERLDAYLDRHAFGVIGTCRPDGRPHATVATYIRQDAVFWLPTMAGTARVRNLHAQPWLTLTVSEGDKGGDHMVVLIEGPARVVPAAEVPADLLTRAPQGWIWVRLTPERLLSYADLPGTCHDVVVTPTVPGNPCRCGIPVCTPAEDASPRGWRASPVQAQAVPGTCGFRGGSV